MTATPRIFDDAVKDKAEEHSAELVSMDDELCYGPEFHRLSFGDAVERGLLTDYKVLVLTVDESVIAAPLQQQLATLIASCRSTTHRRSSAAGTGWPNAPVPPSTAHRASPRGAIRCSGRWRSPRDIAASKQVAEPVPARGRGYQDRSTRRRTRATR